MLNVHFQGIKPYLPTSFFQIQQRFNILSLYRLRRITHWVPVTLGDKVHMVLTKPVWKITSPAPGGTKLLIARHPAGKAYDFFTLYNRNKRRNPLKVFRRCNLIIKDESDYQMQPHEDGLGQNS